MSSIEGKNERSTESGRMSTHEFVTVMPNLSLEDLLLTEYRADGKWSPLIQVNDSKKKLYSCCLCNVSQSGIKNIFSHVRGKKHKLKLKSIVQFYQPKYTYSKTSYGSAPLFLRGKVSIPELHPKSNASFKKDTLHCHMGTKRLWQIREVSHNSNDFEPTRNPEDKSVVPFSSRKAMLINKFNSSRSLNGSDYTKNSRDKCEDFYTLSTDTGNSRDKWGELYTLPIDTENDNGRMISSFRGSSDDPPTKMSKILVNPAAIKKQRVGEIFKFSNPNEGKTVGLSSMTVTSSKNTNSTHRNLLPEPLNDQVFSTKRFLNNDVLGLIGVEYVVKILRRPYDSEPKYECSLCEVVNDGLGMQEHLLGYNHRLKFCEKHFPTAMRQYKQYIRNVKSTEMYKILTPILTKLAIAIENHHGRDLPYECLETEFVANRHEVMSKVYSCRHASEQYGPTFTHIIDSKQVDKLIEDIDKYLSPSFPTSIAFDLCVSKTSYTSPRVFNRKQSDHNSYANYEGQSLHSPYDKGILPGFQSVSCKTVVKEYPYLSSNSTTPNYLFTRETDENLSKWHNPGDMSQVYRHILDQHVTGLNKAFEIYRRDPETHPAYNQEWQAFWKRRKNELIEVGLDHRTYNYQPEWVRYFNIRIEELYNQALKDIKMNVQDKISLSITPTNLVDERCQVNTNVVVGKEIVNDDCLKKHHIILVIRLLTTLEKFLGSLAPDIVEILSTALKANRTNSAELTAIVLNKKNCGILETVMEKFKGLVFANILEDTEQDTLRLAIKGIETLLSNNIYLPQNSLSTMNIFEGIENLLYYNTVTFPATYLPTSVAGKHNLKQTNILEVDKKDLAVKLANLLAAQGKTEIDPTQLQKILSVYMMIEKKKNRNDIK